MQLSSVFGQTPLRAEGKFSQRENPRKKRKSADSDLIVVAFEFPFESEPICRRKKVSEKISSCSPHTLTPRRREIHTLGKFQAKQLQQRGNWKKARHKFPSDCRRRRVAKSSSALSRRTSAREPFLCHFLCARVKVEINQIPK